MKANLTESQFTDLLIQMKASEAVDWLKRKGMSFEPEFLALKRGVYRRETGMDLIEFDGDTWKAFNPSIVGTPIRWGIIGNDWWVKVLTVCYDPVINGFRVQFDRNGRRVG